MVFGSSIFFKQSSWNLVCILPIYIKKFINPDFWDTLPHFWKKCINIWKFDDKFRKFAHFFQNGARYQKKVACNFFSIYKEYIKTKFYLDCLKVYLVEDPKNIILRYSQFNEKQVDTALWFIVKLLYCFTFLCKRIDNLDINEMLQINMYLWYCVIL